MIRHSLFRAFNLLLVPLWLCSCAVVEPSGGASRAAAEAVPPKATTLPADIDPQSRSHLSRYLSW